MIKSQFSEECEQLALFVLNIVCWLFSWKDIIFIFNSRRRHKDDFFFVIFIAFVRELLFDFRLNGLSS